MNSINPQVLLITPNKLWYRQDIVKGIFVEKHNSVENLNEVKKEINTDNIAQNPEHWLFLIEGSKQYHTLENKYLEEFAKKLSIDVKDPIVRPFTENIAIKVSKDNLLCGLSVLVIEFLAFMNTAESTISEERVKDLLENLINDIAKDFNIKASSLQKEFINLPWDNINLLHSQIANFSKIREDLINESNINSRNILLKILTANHSTNILILSGLSHKPVFI